MITFKDIFKVQKRVLSIMLGCGILLSPCIVYKIMEYNYYLQHKGECNYNYFGIVMEYLNNFITDSAISFLLFIGFIEYAGILLVIGLGLFFLIVTFAVWLIKGGV